MSNTLPEAETHTIDSSIKGSNGKKHLTFCSLRHDADTPWEENEQIDGNLLWIEGGVMEDGGHAMKGHSDDGR